MSAWQELVVHAGETAIRAFLAGFLADREGDDAVLVAGDDVDLEPESLGERLKELFLRGAHRVLLAPAPLAEALARALERRGRDVGIVLEDQRAVRGGSFEFRGEVFARPLADELRTALNARPDGVDLVDFHDAEEVHPEGEAVDLYAPVHRFVYRVSGRIAGTFTGVLEMYRRLRGMDFIEVGRLHLETGPHT